MKLPTNKRVVFIGVGVTLALILIAVYVFTRPKTGTLTIAAPEFVEISSARIDDVVLGETVARGLGSQSFSLPVGSYVVSGESESNLYKTIVDIEEAEEKTIEFEEYNPQNLNAQDSLKAKFFTRSSGNYRYLNNEDGSLYTYFGSDVVPERFNYSARGISEVSWVNGSEAVAIADGQLYRVSKNNFTFLNYPNGQQPELDIQPIVTGYSLSDTGQIFAVIDSRLYRYESLSADPELVREVGSFATFPFAAPGGTVVLATDTTLSGHREEGVVNSVIDSGGKKVVDNFSENGVYFVSWSPNSQQFIYGDDVGLWLYNLNSRDSELLVKGSDFSSGNIVWVDDSRFLHYDQNHLWEYDIDSKVGFARYSFSQPDLLSEFITPGSITTLEDELVLSIDTKSTASPSKLFFIPMQEQ